MALKTFLVQTAPSVCFMALTCYFLLQLVSLFQSSIHHGLYAVCTFEVEYSNAALMITVLVSICFMASCLLQVLNLFGVYFRYFSKIPYFSSYNYDDQGQSATNSAKNEPEVQFSLNVTTFTINFIAGSSSLVTYFGLNDGVCKDSLG
jgi:hypothetical protein